MHFVGIGLSWTTKENTGIAIMEGDEFGLRLLKLRLAKADKDILSAVDQAAGDKPVFVAVDAPLINPGKKRRCDDLINLLFGQFASDGKADVSRPGAWSGKRRGESVVEELEALKIVHDPSFRALERSRKCFEVHPYPAMAVIFGLGKLLQYKGAERGDTRQEGFREFQRHLKDLEDLHVSKGFLEVDVASLRGELLEDYEDELDAIFCAYVAYYAWRAPEKCEVLGNMREGYILTPVLRKQAKDFFPKA